MTSAGETTRAAILAAGLDIGRRGLDRVTARTVAAAIDIKHSNVCYYFRSNDTLQAAVARYAVQIGDAKMIARLILDENAAVLHMNDSERRRWMRAAG